MKKIISLLLCFALMLCLAPQVSAKEYNYVGIKLDAGSGASTETAILQDNELYLPAKSYSEITRYTYYEDNLLYLIDGQSQDKAFKTVKINTGNNTLLISSVKVIDLPDIIESDGQVYLPLSIMLPVLNADVAAIIDGIIYISNNELSLGEILYDFNISDYTFNYASEFADNIWLGKLSYELPNYLLDSVTHFRLDRLDVIFKSGDYNDYLDIFTDYLLDDEIYLESMSESDPNLSGLLEIINSTQSINKDFKTVFEWGEEFNNDYFESTKDVFNYLDAYIPYAYNLEDVVDAVNAGDFSIMDALEVVEFFFNYYYQVEDHRKMLDAVYHIDNKVAWNDAERKAARQIYNIYGGDAAEGLLRGVWDKLCESALGIATTPIKMYELTSKVSGTVLQAVLPHDAMQNAAEISKLSLYEAAMYSARSNYYEYRDNLNTDNDVNNLRHSILMTLLSSRSCYNVMLNTAKGYQDSLLATDYSSLISYYEHEINKINALMCLLYKVADNVEYDSYEHIQAFAKEIRKKIADSKIIDRGTGSVQQGNTDISDDDSGKHEKPGAYKNLGNSSCNIANNGQVCEYNKRVYIVKENREIYAFPYKNPDAIELVLKDEEWICDINIVNNTLYYHTSYYGEQSSIKCMNLSNGERSVIYTADSETYISQMQAVDEWIYILQKPSLFVEQTYNEKTGYFRINTVSHQREAVALSTEIDKEYQRLFGSNNSEILSTCSQFAVCADRIFFVANHSKDIKDSYSLFSASLTGKDLLFHSKLSLKDSSIINRVYSDGSNLYLECSVFAVWDNEPRYYLYKIEIGEQIESSKLYIHSTVDEAWEVVVDKEAGQIAQGTFYQLHNDRTVYIQVDSYKTQNISIGVINSEKNKEVLYYKIYPQRINTYNTYIAGDYLFWGNTSPIAFNLLTGDIIEFFEKEEQDAANDDQLLKMDSEQIQLEIFGQANQIYYWCQGMNPIGTLSNDECFQDESYRPYYKVLSNEFSNYEEFRTHILQFFSKELTDHMLSLGSVMNVNGDLYQFMPGYGGPDTTYSVEYYIDSHSDGRIVYCQQSKYFIDPWADIPADRVTEADLNTVNRYFVRQKIDGKWIFVEWASSEKP